MSRDAVARLELGLRAARLDTVVRLAAALDLRPDELLAPGDVPSKRSALRQRIDRCLDGLTEDSLAVVLAVSERFRRLEERTESRD